MSQLRARPDVRIVAWAPADFRARLHEAMVIYADAMGYSQQVIDGRVSHAEGHSRRPGFQAVAALDSDDVLRGFGYGYSSRPGQWWHDQVRRAVDDRIAGQWLTDCFELCELHVSPHWQGGGIGRDVLRTLLRGVRDRVVLLSTPEGDSRAWSLYRSLGFVDLARRHLFPGDRRPFAVLGTELPLPDA